MINVQVIHDGSDITSKVIRFNRDHAICTGIGTLQLEIEWKSGLIFHPWDEVVIYENGDKKGTFFVDSVGKDSNSGSFLVDCQDNSKRASDYFVTDAHNIDGITYARYWIGLFLDLAGVNYEFTVADDGAVVAPNSGFGFDSVHNIIFSLLQQSGWYIYYNPNGKAIIGHLNKGLSNVDYTLDETKITNIVREQDDSRLRNRAVVWGNAVPELGGSVFVDISVNTPWDIDSNDQRPVVFASPSLYDYSEALNIANQMLNEFTQIKDEKFIVCDTEFDIQIGDVVRVNSNYWSGNGLVTGVTCDVSKDGKVYTITLDEKCPRLFAYFAYYPPIPSGGWVYTGHAGDGIWKKHTESTTWYSSSFGLENLFISDLFVKNDSFVTVAGDGYLYTRVSDLSSWSKYHPGILRDTTGIEYPEENLAAIACSINLDGNIVAGYNTVSGIVASGFKSWVLELTPAQQLIKAEQVSVVMGNGPVENLSIYDLESSGDYNIVTISSFAPLGYNLEAINYFKTGGVGTRILNDDAFQLGGDYNSYSFGPPLGTSASTNFLHHGQISRSRITEPICDDDLNYWYFSYGDAGNILHLVELSPVPDTVTIYDIDLSSGFQDWEDVPFSPGITGVLRKKDSNTFDLFVRLPINPSILKVKHYTYTLGGSFTEQFSTDFTLAGHSFTAEELACCGDKVGFRFIDSGFALPTIHKVFTYDFDIHSSNTIELADSDNNPGASSFYFNDGRDLFFTAVWTKNEDSYQMLCGAFLETFHRRVSVYGRYVRISPLLGVSTSSDILMDSVTENVKDGIDDSDFTLGGGSGFGNAFSIDLEPRDIYLRATLTWRSADCADPTSDKLFYIQVYTFRINALELQQIAFVGPLTYAEPYYDSTALVPLKKSANSSSIIFQSGLLSHYLHRRYGSPYLLTLNYTGDNSTGDHVYRLRRFPTQSLVTTKDFSDFETQPGPRIMDDVDNSIYFLGSNLVEGYDETLTLRKTFTTLLPVAVGGTEFTQNFLLCITSTGAYLQYLNTDWINNLVGGEILKHTSTTTISGFTATDSSLLQTQGVFEIIHSPDKVCKVEISKGTPTVVYSVPQTGDLESSILDASILNTFGSFYSHSDLRQVFCSRVFDLLEPGTFPTISGTFDPDDFERFIGITNTSLEASKYDLTTPWVGIVVGSGVTLNQLETSNYTYPGPYIFYTISGTGEFYQKNPYESFWHNYSAGFPTSDCTIIRMDDSV